MAPNRPIALRLAPLRWTFFEMNRATGRLLWSMCLCGPFLARADDVALPQSIGRQALSDSLSERIVGGTNAKHGEFPSFAWLGGCGGNLVAEDVVLSAGHCYDAFDSHSVLVGSTLKGSIRQPGAEWRKYYPAKRVVHPTFSMDTLKNDFMLVKIQRVSNATATPPAKLDTTGAPLVNAAVETVIGFGLTNENSWQLSKTLRKVDVNYIPTPVCNNLAKYRDDIDPKSMFCVGVKEGGKDSCSGDSGGPIFDKTTGVQIGTVSWGIGCAEPNAPGVYGRVAGQIQWIQDTICVLTDTQPDFCVNRDLPKQLTYKFVVNYGATPRTFGWSIKDLQSGSTIVSYPVGKVRKPHAKVEKEFSLKVGNSYTLTMIDKSTKKSRKSGVHSSGLRIVGATKNGAPFEVFKTGKRPTGGKTTKQVTFTVTPAPSK